MVARYDREADVLYVSVGAQEEAGDAELTDEDIVLRRRAGKLVGFSQSFRAGAGEVVSSRPQGAGGDCL